MANGNHTVRLTGTAVGRINLPTRTTAYLSDGSFVVGFLDANQSDYSGDGGDSTGVSKLYIYHMPADRSTVTLKNTVTVGVSSTNSAVEPWSMAVDASGNLHITWLAKDGSVKYVKGTYSAGPTWSMSGAVVVLAIPTYAYKRVDIDCMGTGDNPVIVAFQDNSATPSIGVVFSVKNNSGTWVTGSTWYPIVGERATNYYQISVSACTEAAPDGSGYNYFAVACGITTAISSRGASMRAFQVNLATGASTANYDLGTSGTTINFHRLFYDGASSGTKTWVFMGSYLTAINASDRARVFYMSVRRLGPYPGTGYSTYNSPWLDTSPVVQSGQAGDSPLSATWNPVDKKLAIFWEAQGVVKGVIGVWNTLTNAVSWHGNPCDQGDLYTSPTVTNSILGSPQSRNCDDKSSDYLLFENYTYNLIQSRYAMDTGISAVQSPASGAVVQTARPVMVPGYNCLISHPPRWYKTQFQFATDVGFTTNVTNFIPDDSYLQLLAGDPANPTTYTSGAPYQLASSLSQGTWYCRSRLVDDFGTEGPWQTLPSPYTVSHAPSAANLQPGTGNVVMFYGSPTTFSWTFSDPYSADVQTAYQVIVERISDNAIIWDTGKVSSAVSSASTTIGALYKDTLLRWKVRLWDSGDVVGEYVTSAATFQVTDQPVVTITAPSPGTITTAIPTITWTNGISAPKTQRSYRVVITSGAVTLKDTDWVLGSATSYTVPLGVLSNNLSCTVTVYVEDSLGLQDTGTVAFTVSYVLPAVPTGAATALVYLFEYQNRGFVYVSLDGSGPDTDFQSFNLYRRAFGGTEWTLLKAWSLPGVRLVYQDYSAVSGETYEYAVSQTVNRYGDIIESNRATLRMATPVDDKYWMFSRTDNAKSMPLFGVTDDGYTDEYEQETYNIIGRGRHIDYGDRLGLNGSMTVKLRDRMTSGVAKVNYLKAPRFIVHTSDNVDPDQWTTGNGGTVGTKSVGYPGAQEPTPCGALQNLAITASAMGTATADYVELVQAVSQAEMPMSAATNFVASIYVGGLPVAVNIVIFFTYYNVSNGVISTSSLVNLSPSEYYLPTPGVGHVDYGYTGQYWARYYQAGTTPSNYDHMTVTFRMRGTGSGTSGLSKTFNLSAGQLELGTTPTVYVDGAQIGGQWRGSEELSSSETTGFYTARQMKQDVEAFKYERDYGFLRTPFGDLYSVALGNVSLKRIAGVAANEFSDVEIPYTEVGF